MATRMLQRRGTAAAWAAENPVLGDGEIGFETDTKIIKVGDGSTSWNALGLPYLPTAGGTLTGALNVLAPVSPNHPVRLTDLNAATSALSNIEVVVFTTSGAFIKGDYSWATRAKIMTQAGGGGGGGSGTGGGSGGGGGGGGECRIGILELSSLSSSETVTIGIGGDGGTTTGGGVDGAASSFGSLIITVPGSGGKYGVDADATERAHGGVGGHSGSGGDYGVPGNGGGAGHPGEPTSGTGGSSFLGAGGRGAYGLVGVSGYQGGGGSGGARIGAGGQPGGDGGDGIVVVELYG